MGVSDGRCVSVCVCVCGEGLRDKAGQASGGQSAFRCTRVSVSVTPHNTKSYGK